MLNTTSSTGDMEVKVIRSDGEYRAYLREVEQLMVADPEAGTPDGDRLELLSLLVEDYEKRTFPFERPDPIEAIKFRMNEQGLRQADLVPYFGSRSRVSEVLSRKRPLTVQMIRDLSAGLGIPSQILVARTSETANAPGEPVEDADAPWERFPVKEMAKHGYFAGLSEQTNRDPMELARAFYTRITSSTDRSVALARRSLRGDAVTPKSTYALTAWKLRVLDMGRRKRTQRSIPKYKAEELDTAFLRRIAQLSWYPNGPRAACDLVESIGIPVVIEAHLSGTYLDGAAILDSDGSPVIGVTLRIDRIDNFWFTLLHELAHVMKHLSQPGDAFLDRLEDREASDELEVQANRIARDALIPRAVWKRSEVLGAPTHERILRLARELKIHPAIIAGRVRRESGNYRILGDLLGSREVSKLLARPSLSEA